MKKLTDLEFLEAVKNFKSKGRVFTVNYAGNVKTFRFQDRLIFKCQPKIFQNKQYFKPSEFRSFLSVFNKSLFNQLNTVEGLSELKIEHKYKNTVKVNSEIWNNYPIGEVIYEFDIKSAYWQTARLLQYIDQKTYDKYIDDQKRKMYKRLCFSFLARHKKVVHYLPDQTLEIYCENEHLKRVYDNVRINLTNNVQDVVSQLDTYIKFNVDAIYVDLKNATIVNKALKKIGYDFHFRVWCKYSDTEIANKHTIKKFV